MTPYEAWTGERPNVNHLRAFGCAVHAHISKDERRKLDPKSRKCILLGYGTTTKGYRLYDPQRTRVFYSRDVLFNELERGIKEIVQEEKRCVQLDSVTEEEPVTKDTPEPVLWRSERERRPPTYYGEWANMTNTSKKEPKTYKDALASSDGTKWQKAMATEIESLGANDVWDLVELPRDQKAVGSKWLFKLKVAADSSTDRYKTRLVAQGFSQKFGVDYDKTFCPVVRPESVRAVIALAAQNDLKLHQMDVTTAFLNGELKDEVYMKQPEGFIERGQEHLVCRLNRSIYGLKQSPRCWNSALDVCLKAMGFAQSPSDPCVYTSTEGEMFVIAVYVDDILLAGKTDKQIAEVKKALSECFKVRDMGKLHYFLGVKVALNYETGETWIGQSLYTESILQKFGMEDSKPVNTPVDTSTKLETATEDCETINHGLYQSAVGRQSTVLIKLDKT